MIDHDDEQELRARFRALADSDRATAPPFRVAHRVRSRAIAWWALAAAAVVVLAVGLAARQRLHHEAVSVAAPSITSWRSPTAALLPTMRTTMRTTSDILIRSNQ